VTNVVLPSRGSDHAESPQEAHNGARFRVKEQQGLFEAEGVGFEPTERLTTFNGFRDRHGQRKVPAKRHFGRAEGTREGTKSTNPSTDPQGGPWERRHRDPTGQSTTSVRSATPCLIPLARSCTGPGCPSIRVDPVAATGSAFSMKAWRASRGPPRRASFAATGGACCSRRRSRRASSPKELWTLAGEREQASPRSTQGGEPCRTPSTSQAGGSVRVLNSVAECRWHAKAIARPGLRTTPPHRPERASPGGPAAGRPCDARDGRRGFGPQAYSSWRRHHAPTAPSSFRPSGTRSRYRKVPISCSTPRP
jgi:hypothetical protein